MAGGKAAPCRLTVFLAREAAIGVVLRRGPSAWERLSLWHTDRDTFEHGQWFRGRIYERRSDLSADGSLFLYFARTSGASARAGQRADTWVAISRPPWLTALALWFVGGTYCSGGFFPARRSKAGDRRRVWLGWTDPPDQGQLPPWLAIADDLPPYVDRTNNWTERTVYLNRLLRDGWQRVLGASAETWERREPGGQRRLVMTQTDFNYRAEGGAYVHEYGVRAEPDADPTALGRATWADWDQHGRLVLARDGRLYQWEPPAILSEIADFNAQTPDPAPSPDQARLWPPVPTRPG